MLTHLRFDIFQILLFIAIVVKVLRNALLKPLLAKSDLATPRISQGY